MMNKAVISNRIYMNCSAETQEHIESEVKHIIPSWHQDAQPEIINNMAIIRAGLVTIPSGRTDLIPEGYEISDKRITCPVDFPEFRFDLRESQQVVHDQINEGCIINAWVSWGKTFTALAIAAKLRQKTLIIVHTVSLRNQWEKEIQKVFGITPSVIGSGRFETDGPIVVANVQTLHRKQREVSKLFGTIILDEMHHVSSKTFSSIIDASHARYKIGLTGTLKRKDGKQVLFKDYFGDIVYKPPKENYMVPRVHLIRTEIRFMDGSNTPWAKKINELTQKEEYVHLISMLAAAYSAKGHKVLVVSDRVAFLNNCAELVGESAVAITGKTPNREEIIESVRRGEKDIVFGTQSIFSEGISVDNLSCLILGTPVNNESLLTQLIGRVIREKEGKKQPIVVDINLKGSTAKRQAQARRGHYIQEGYKVEILEP